MLCSALFPSSPAQQPKLPLERWRSEAHALPRPGLRPSPAPARGLPGHLPRPALPPAQLHRHLLPLCHTGPQGEHKAFSKFGKPVWEFKLPFHFPSFLFSFNAVNSLSSGKNLSRANYCAWIFKWRKSDTSCWKTFFYIILLFPSPVQQCTFQTGVSGL